MVCTFCMEIVLSDWFGFLLCVHKNNELYGPWWMSWAHLVHKLEFDHMCEFLVDYHVCDQIDHMLIEPRTKNLYTTLLKL